MDPTAGDLAGALGGGGALGPGMSEWAGAAEEEEASLQVYTQIYTFVYIIHIFLLAEKVGRKRPLQVSGVDCY